MKVPYNSSYYPPAPYVQVQFGRPGEPFTTGSLLALINTGADATLLPANAVRALRVRPSRPANLRSPWGDRQPVRVYRLNLGLGALRLPSVEVVADESNSEVILGRNALNKLRILLDGPSETVELPDGR